MTSSPPDGRIVAGKYLLERALARGGMGSVWIAKDQQLERGVAIKFMEPSLVESSDARVRFEREAKAAAQLQSPHVVQVYDYGIDEGAPFLVMELLAGEAFSARLKREKRLNLRDTALMLVPVCKALQQAHDAGIVHRDMKPANLFIAKSGDEEVVKILDFGIAKAMGMGEAGDTTKTGALLGSPQFMSPEQVRASKHVNHQSDLWSLGVITYRALTGRIPFKGEELGDVLVRICSDPVTPPSQLVPELSPAIDAFFVRALARDLGERFQSAREMSAAFMAIVTQEEGDTGLSRSSMAPPSITTGTPSGWSQTPASAPSIPPAQALTSVGDSAPNAIDHAPSASPNAAAGKPALLWAAVAAGVFALIGATYFATQGGGSPTGEAAVPVVAEAPPAAPPPAAEPPVKAPEEPVIEPAATAAPDPEPPVNAAPSKPATAAPKPSPKPEAAPPPAPVAPPPAETAKKPSSLDMDIK